jgi:hypothetical protein
MSNSFSIQSSLRERRFYIAIVFQLFSRTAGEPMGRMPKMTFFGMQHSSLPSYFHLTDWHLYVVKNMCTYTNVWLQRDCT